MEIVPITNIAHVYLEDLVGYESAKKKLIDNTEAFVAGRRANNCLLFGDAGTGKSSSIKGILNRYYDRGLRIIEVYKHQFQDLNDIIAQIKNRNYRFIIYMDDLSFEEFEIEYKYLKAVIEGGLEKKPDNILIYATSNRRHLIRENFSDKEETREDMHTSDTVQEKLSLVYRFGVSIYFGSPSKKEFQNIVKVLAERQGIDMPQEELLLEAGRWEMNHGGLSGRTAQQFIDYLFGQTSAGMKRRKAMAVKLFGAIVIGSMETEMKIFELSARKGMKEIDCVSARIHLGVDAYSKGRLDVEKVEELCTVLKEFKQIMEGYRVDGFKVCATSALREIRSSLITRDYIEKQTGLKIEILSNSEQRFLDYKSIASESDSFETIISSGTAIVDIGGSSIQISVFDKDKLITTQNIRMGKVSTREKFMPLAKNNAHYEKLVLELMEHELNGFGKLYQKDRQISNLIVIDGDLVELMRKQEQSSSISVVSKEEFEETYRRIVCLNPDEVTEQFHISSDSAPFVVSSVIFCRCLMEKTGGGDHLASGDEHQ